MPFLRNIALIALLTIIMQVKSMPGPYPNPEHPVGVTANTAFTKFYNTINILIKAKKWSELNKYVHPDYGFYIYDNPGVRALAFNFSKFDNLIDSTGNRDEVIINKMQDLKADLKRKLISSKVPVWDCSMDKWNKKGSYCQDISSCPDLTENVLSSLGSEDNPIHPKVLKAKQFGKFIKKHVVQTAGYDIYFAFIDGNWYIAVIDLCDKCSA